MSDYTNENSYDYESNNQEVVADVAVDATEAVVADAVSENIVEESYEIKDGDEIIAARDMANAVNYDLIILIVLVVALIGGAVFFFLKQRQGHQQVPTSDPEEQKEEEAAAETPAEKETIVAENQE